MVKFYIFYKFIFSSCISIIVNKEERTKKFLEILKNKDLLQSPWITSTKVSMERSLSMPTNLCVSSKANSIKPHIDTKSIGVSPLKKNTKNNTIADFNLKIQDEKMRSLLNPFNYTANQESVLRYSISTKEFIPNTCINKKYSGKLKECFNIDLPKIAKSINRYTPTQSGEQGPRKTKRKKKAEASESEQMAEDERIKDIICSEHCPNDSIVTVDSAYGKPSYVKNSSSIQFNMKQKVFDEELLQLNFAVQFKDNNSSIQNLGFYPKIKGKCKSNNIFEVDVKLPGDQWKADRKILALANPHYARVEKEYFERDKMFLNKRRQGSLLKNFALDQDLKIKTKKIDVELRNKIF